MFHWILIAILMTPQGPVPTTGSFEFQYQCLDRLQTLQRQYPGTTGHCDFN